MTTKLLLCCFADYAEEIYQTFVNASKEALKDAATKLKEKTPAPMNRMLERQPREEAIQKRVERKEMKARDVPPTTPGGFCFLFFLSQCYFLFISVVLSFQLIEATKQ